MQHSFVAFSRLDLIRLRGVKWTQMLCMRTHPVAHLNPMGHGGTSQTNMARHVAHINKRQPSQREGEPLGVHVKQLFSIS